MEFMLGWSAFIFVVVGVILNGNKNLWCWPVWVLSNVLTILYCYTLVPIAYPLIIENLVLIALNVYGWRKWYKEKKN